MTRYKYWFLVALLTTTVIAAALDSYRSGYRWQMLPVYIASLLLLSSLVILKLKIVLPLLFPTVAGVGIVSLLTTAVFSYLDPSFTLPVPTGRHAVGTTSIHLIDRSRRELCDPAANSARELVLQVWYPTTSTNGTKVPYRHDARLNPSEVFSDVGAIQTNAIRDVPIATATAPYPVLLYTPSWSGYKTDNTFQTQDLASHGFVVIGLEHPCSVPIAIYPNGRKIYSNLSADYTSSDAALAKWLRVGAEQLALRTQDIAFVLDRLPQIASNKLFNHTLNLNKIGIFGHSFGGAAAAQACALDSRLKAGMNMDGLLFGSAAQQGASQPFFFMNSDYPRPTTADLNSPNGSLRRSKQTDAWGYQQRDRWFDNHGGYNLTILGSAHMNFSDLPLTSPHSRSGGSISTDLAMKIINEYTVAFFDLELNGKHSVLLDRSFGSPFVEVLFQNHFQLN
jgi:Platelet-activating factor acetylhydrolase, isoform II